MAQTTEIEWTHMPGYTGVTWNPTRGCSRVSEGCRNCYAETIAKRFSGDAAESVDRTAPFWSFATHRGWTGKVELIESKLAEPLSNRKPWKDPCCVFVNSMSDLFHEALPDTDLYAVWLTMFKTPQHRYLILTKRAERMPRAMSPIVAAFGVLPNVWLGCSVEDQSTADARIPHLLRTPAAVRFVSLEPQLEAVDLREYLWEGIEPTGRFRTYRGRRQIEFSGQPLLSLVISGFESGPEARPGEVAWLRQTRDHCAATKTAWFCKQLGANPMENGKPLKLRDRKGGTESEWPADLQGCRAFPALITEHLKRTTMEMANA